VLKHANTALTQAHKSQLPSVDVVFVKFCMPDAEPPLGFLRAENLARHLTASVGELREDAAFSGSYLMSCDMGMRDKREGGTTDSRSKIILNYEELCGTTVQSFRQF
jgi:hypothetical protein